MNGTLQIRPGTRLAYAISSLTTLLWFACVLPAGPLVASGLSEDFATPMYRAAWLLVPALFVLVIGPVGIVLSQGRGGRLAVLAATDAFLAGYAGIAVLGRLDMGEILGHVRARNLDPRVFVEAGLILLLLVLATLSAIELVRILRRGPEHRVPPLLRGLRLAICLFVLVIPAGMLLGKRNDLAPLLVPFVFVGAGAAGPALGRAPLALRLTASIVHLLLAIYVLLVLRVTILDQAPHFARIGPIGQATFSLAGLLVALALLQVVRMYRRQRAVRGAPARTLDAGSDPISADA